MIRFRRRRRRSGLTGLQPDEPPLTPMIDVVFQLLIFFMLTMNFKEVEGKLMSHLPKTKGMPSTITEPLKLEELRIVLCADGDVDMHLTNKGRHEKIEKDGEVCQLLVEKHPIGEAYQTKLHPDRDIDNASLYRDLAVRASEVHLKLATREGDQAPVIIDADSEVPYEHVIGVVNALKEVDVQKIEFVGNSKFTKYYGN